MNLPSVQNIKLESVDVVPPDQVRDPGYALSLALSGKNRSPMVRVEFSTSDDFQKIAVNWKYGVGNLTGLCKDGGVDPDRHLMGLADVYDPVAMIDMRRPTRYGPSRKTGEGMVRYHVYFDPRWIFPYHWRGDRLFSYDLTRTPADVCVGIAGSREDELPMGFATNVVRISKAELIAAFKRANLHCSDSEIACR